MNSFIIFLKGILIDDYKNIEDEFNERLLENITQNDLYKNEHIQYDIIPPIFESMEKWPKTTNIRCWTCDFTFVSIPIFIPLSIKQIDDIWIIGVLGNFCSFTCASRHIIDYLDKDLQDNLIKLYEIYYNVKIHKIEPTPRRTLMEKYGGYMTEETFLKTIKRLSLRIEQNDNIKREYIPNKKYDGDMFSEDENLWNIENKTQENDCDVEENI
jgi:hypothetical protein